MPHGLVDKKNSRYTAFRADSLFSMDVCIMINL